MENNIKLKRKIRLNSIIFYISLKEYTISHKIVLKTQNVKLYSSEFRKLVWSNLGWICPLKEQLALSRSNSLTYKFGRILIDWYFLFHVFSCCLKLPFCIKPSEEKVHCMFDMSMEWLHSSHSIRYIKEKS